MIVIFLDRLPEVVIGGKEVVLFFCDATSLVAIIAEIISTLIFTHHNEGKGGDETVFIVYVLYLQ